MRWSTRLYAEMVFERAFDEAWELVRFVFRGGGLAKVLKARPLILRLSSTRPICLWQDYRSLKTLSEIDFNLIYAEETIHLRSVNNPQPSRSPYD
jgi:hypothetical protein